jgi:hypothetical protein
MSLLLTAQGAQEHLLDGAVTLSLTPSATMLEGRVLSGAVTMTLTPAATMLEGRVLAGAVTLTLTPAAVMVGPVSAVTPAVGGRPRRQGIRRRLREPQHHELWGFVALTLTPKARFTRIRDGLWTALPAFLEHDLDDDELVALTMADQWLN